MGPSPMTLPLPSESTPLISRNNPRPVMRSEPSDFLIVTLSWNELFRTTQLMLSMSNQKPGPVFS